MNTLFQTVVATTGISALFADNAIQRACQRAGVDADKLSPGTLKVALSEIERTVRTFRREEIDEIMRRLGALAR